MKTALIIIVLATLTAIGMSGCGSSKSACEESIGHVYDVNCEGSIAFGVGSTTKQDAINGCNDTKKLIDANTCPCKSQFESGVDCFKTLTKSDCTTCNSELTSLTSCFTNNATACGFTQN
jgi:hypothetical protein